MGIKAMQLKNRYRSKNEDARKWERDDNRKNSYVLKGVYQKQMRGTR